MKVIQLLSRITMSFCICMSIQSKAQLTITAGTKWQDVMLVKSENPGEEYTATTNYNTTPRLSASAWTHSSQPVYYRSLIRFDLDMIPQGATIQSATLYLYSNPAFTSGEASNSPLSGSNAVYFQKVTQPWDENTVTWNTQPTTTTTNRVWVGPSTSATENIQVNLTAMVQDLYNNPSSNYGVMMMLESEIYYRSRSYASANHTNSAIQPKIVINYTVPDPIKDRMDHIFGALNQSFINTGILTDYGLDLIDQTKFDGVIRTDNIMEINSWRALYGSLLSSVINPSSNMIHLKTINDRLDNYLETYNRNNPTIDLPTQFISYQSLRSDAISQNLISVSNERLNDVAGRTQSPYTTSYSFATAPNIDFDKDGHVTFIFRSDLFVNSSSKILSSFSVDFNDGVGYQVMTVNTAKTIIYTTVGTKNLKFKIQFTDGTIYYSHANFTILAVSTNPTARYEATGAQDYTFPRATATVCPEAGFANPEVWEGSFYGATVTVEYGTLGNRPAPGCTPQLIRPLIVIEGYDPSKFRALASNWNYRDDFIIRATNGAIAADSDPSPTIFRSLSDRLETAGYDMIFVDLREGTGDIIRNAYLLENIIQWVNSRKINNPVTGIQEGNVVIGQSMGGLIGRYAICDMEKRRLASSTYAAHEVRLFISQDVPHRGANVPFGFQAMVNELAPYRLTKIGLVGYGTVGAVVGSFFELQDVIPALKQANKLLDEPASSQMLIVQDGRSNTFLDGRYRTMVTFAPGYTPTFQMRAIANGSECGLGQVLQPGGEIFFADANAYIHRMLFTMISTNTAAGVSYFNGGLGVIVFAALNVLTPFTGKNWKTKFIVRATPSSGTNEAFYGRISFEKRILLLVPVNIPIFTRSRTSPTGILPIDSSPGGYYPAKSFEGSVPAVPTIRAYPIVDVNLTVNLLNFNFVPTVSALDIVTAPIPVAALTSPYTNGVSPNYASRFINFKSQERDDNEISGSIYNSRHIQFTPRNALWMFNEMQNVANNTLNCSTECNPYPSVTISGNPSVCNSTVFSTTAPITGASFNWIVSSNLTITGGQYSPSLTVKANGSGTGTVNLSITQNGCSFSLPQRTVQVGTITASQLHIYYSGTSQEIQNMCPNMSYSINATGPTGITFSNWTFQGNFSSTSVSGNTAYVTTASNFSGGSIAVTGSDNCGASVEVRRTITTSSCTLGLSVYPNPGDDYVEVELSDGTDTNSLTVAEEYSIFIYDRNGNKIKSKRSNLKKNTFTVDDLSQDLYFIQIQYKGQVYAKQFMIQR